MKHPILKNIFISAGVVALTVGVATFAQTNIQTNILNAVQHIMRTVYTDNGSENGIINAEINSASGNSYFLQPVGAQTNNPNANLQVVGNVTFGDINNFAGYPNDAQFNSVLGGLGNHVETTRSTIAGGVNNNIVADAGHSFIGGGGFNTAHAWASTIGGGEYNTINNGYATAYATIAGGINNKISADDASIGGGRDNEIRLNGIGGSIPGGKLNVVDGESSFAAGKGAYSVHNNTFVWSDGTMLPSDPSCNTPAVIFACTIQVGCPVQCQNAGTPFESTNDNQFLIYASNGVGINTNTPGASLHISGNVMVDVIPQLGSLNGTTPVLVQGPNNEVQYVQASQLGGGGFSPWEVGAGLHSVQVIGDGTNQASGGYSVVGGRNNNGVGMFSFIGGGQDNIAIGNGASIIGGFNNLASGHTATIAGGVSNKATEDSFVGGGLNNNASGLLSVVVGGQNNTVLGNISTIGGGSNNSILGVFSKIGGGLNNTITGDYSFIGGGRDNSIGGDNNFIGGSANIIATGLNQYQNQNQIVGHRNTLTGGNSTVIGFNNQSIGHQNFIFGAWSSTSGSYNLSLGHTINIQGTSIGGINMDSMNGLNLSQDNSFVINAPSGVGINETQPSQALDVNGNIRAQGTFVAPSQNGGITQTINLQDALGACTLTVEAGIITATTCNN